MDLRAGGDNSDLKIPDFLKDIPVKALNHSTRKELALHLNVEDRVSGNDWRSLAEKIGCRYIEIMNMEQKDSPTEAVLTAAMQKELTVYQLMSHVRAMHRRDVIEECMELVKKDAQKYQELKLLQDSEVSSSREPLTFGELETGEIEYFDAFVSFHPEDIKFVEKLLEILEEQEKLKLCITARDVIVGIGENAATAELIEKRCKRVIIVLSKSYVYSEEDNFLKWQLNFTQALAPTGRSINKIIPILIEPGVTIPAILRPYNVSDYTSEALRQWFWDRIKRSLRAKTYNKGGYEGPDGPLTGRTALTTSTCVTPGERRTSGIIEPSQRCQSLPTPSPTDSWTMLDYHNTPSEGPTSLESSTSSTSSSHSGNTQSRQKKDNFFRSLFK